MLADGSQVLYAKLRISCGRIHACADGRSAHIHFGDQLFGFAEAQYIFPRVVAKALNSCPNVMGTASCNWVRPILSTVENSFPLL